jgi:hypothetical protein
LNLGAKVVSETAMVTVLCAWMPPNGCAEARRRTNGIRSRPRAWAADSDQADLGGDDSATNHVHTP